MFCNKKKYCLTKKNAHRLSHPLSVEEIKQNLTTFIYTALSKHTEEELDPCQPLLVVKHVSHIFSGCEYRGQVISVVPGFSKWYNIVYDGELAVYTYTLQDDYFNGSITIMICGIFTDGLIHSRIKPVNWYFI